MAKKQDSLKYDDRTSQLMDLRAKAEQQFDKQVIYLVVRWYFQLGLSKISLALINFLFVNGC